MPPPASWAYLRADRRVITCAKGVDGSGAGGVQRIEFGFQQRRLIQDSGQAVIVQNLQDMGHGEITMLRRAVDIPLL